MSNYNVAVVIPTIRDLSFLEAWRDELRDTFLIVCEDRDSKTVELPDGYVGEVYSHEEMRVLLKENYFIIPRKNASVRSFGYYRAYQLGIPYVITIDDDCYPHTPNFVQTHIDRLETPGDDRWMKTSSVYTRGFPYEVRDKMETVINHGLWAGVPDLDGPTQLLNSSMHDVDYPNIQIPKGTYFPMCGMNLSFKRKITPALYFLLMGIDYPFDRFDDIWAGVIAKKICDRNNLSVRSGDPAVRHSRASNVWSNIQKESSGLPINEELWKFIDRSVLSEGVMQSYSDLAQDLSVFSVFYDMPRPYSEYFRCLSVAMHAWLGLFS